MDRYQFKIEINTAYTKILSKRSFVVLTNVHIKGKTSSAVYIYKENKAFILGLSYLN